MLKYILVLFLIVGCSQEKQFNSSPSEEISYEAGIGITTTSGNYGEVVSTKMITFNIKNTGDASLIGPASLDNTNFVIGYQNGCSPLVVGKTCSVKISFDPKGKSPGLYKANLNLDSFFIELSATIPAPPTPAPEIPQVLYQFNSVGGSILEIDYGTLTQTQSVSKTFYIKNLSTVSINQSVAVGSKYAILYDACSNKILNKNSSCMMKISLSGIGKSGDQNDMVSFAGANLNLKGFIQTAELPPQIIPAPKVSYSLSNSIITSADFGEIDQESNKMLTFTIKNTGNVSLNEQIQLTGLYDLNYDTCSNKLIPVNSSCQIKVLLSGAGKNGSIAGNISYGFTNLSLIGVIASPAQPTLNLFPQIVFLKETQEVTAVDMGFFPYGSSQQLIINIKNTGTLGDVSKSASLNNLNFSIAYNQCINKTLAVGQSCQVRIVFAANGKPEGIYNSILSFGDSSLSLAAFAGNAVITYQAIYSEYGSCSATNVCSGQGIKNRTITACQKLANGSPIEGGVLSDCDSLNIISNTSTTCPSPAGQMVVEVSNGDKTVECPVGSSLESFVSVSCNSGFFVNGQTCSPKLCTELTAGELTSLGYNLTGATISGTYNSCTVTCSSPLQQLATDGKSCEDKTPTGTISFAQDYTKILTPNSVNITSSDAQSIQFYSDAGCSTTSGTAISLPLASTNLTLSPGDGTKNVYAKLINGTKSSSCLSDNIILDQTNPTLAIVSPIDGASFSNSTVILSGTCSDINPISDFSVEVDGISSSNQSISCSSGTFSLNYPIPSGIEGLNMFKFVITDSSNNSLTSYLNFNYLINQTLSLNIQGNGQITTSPGNTVCSAATCSSQIVKDSNITLTASPTIGWSFVGWSGDCSGTSNCNLTMQSDQTATAVFEIIPTLISKNINQIDIMTNSFGGITKTGAGSATSGTGVTATGTGVTNLGGATATGGTTDATPPSTTALGGAAASVDNSLSTVVLSGTTDNSIYNCFLEGAVFFSNCTLPTSLSYSVNLNKTSLSSETQLNLNLNEGILPIPVKQYTVTQITNTATSSFSDGLVPGFAPRVFNNEIYFASNVAASVTLHIKLFKLSDNDTLTQMSNICPTCTTTFGDNVFFPITTNTQLNTIESTSSLNNGAVFNNELYFTANNTSGVTKLMKINTSGSITTVSNLRNSLSTADLLGSCINFNSAYYCSGSVAAGVQKLVRINANGTINLLSNTVNSVSVTDNISASIVFNGELYFSAYNSSKVSKLFKINTSGTITQVTNIAGAQTTSDHHSNFGGGLLIFNNALYINAENVGKLYKLNTAGTLTKISNIAGASSDNIQIYGVMNNELVFRATTAGTLNKLFKLSTSDVITQISNIRGSATTDGIGSAVAFNNTIYFSANNSNGVSKLFKINAQGDAVQVSNTSNSQTVADSISGLMVYDNSLIFLAKNAAGFNKIHRIDSSDNISQFVNIAGAAVNDGFTLPQILKGDIYFYSNTGTDLDISKLFRIRKTSP